MKVQIKRLLHPENSDMRAYFTRTVLTEVSMVMRRGMEAYLAEDAPKNALMDATLEIPGVVEIQLQPYILTLTKVPTYGWEEIEPTVLRLLSAFELGEGSLEGPKPFEPPEVPEMASTVDLEAALREFMKRMQR